MPCCSPSKSYYIYTAVVRWQWSPGTPNFRNVFKLRIRVKNYILFYFTPFSPRPTLPCGLTESPEHYWRTPETRWWKSAGPGKNRKWQKKSCFRTTGKLRGNMKIFYLIKRFLSFLRQRRRATYTRCIMKGRTRRYLNVSNRFLNGPRFESTQWSLSDALRLQKKKNHFYSKTFVHQGCIM